MTDRTASDPAFDSDRSPIGLARFAGAQDGRKGVARRGEDIFASDELQRVYKDSYIRERNRLMLARKERPRYRQDYGEVLTTIPPQYRNTRTREVLSEEEWLKLPASPEAEAAEREAQDVTAHLQERQDTHKRRVENVEGVARMQRQDITEHAGRLLVLERDNTDFLPRLAGCETGLQTQNARLVALETAWEDGDDTQALRTWPERMARVEGILAAAAPLDGITLAERLSGMEHEFQAVVERIAEADDRWKSFVDTQCRENARTMTALKKTRKMAKRALRGVSGAAEDQIQGREAWDAHDGSIEKLTNNAMKDRIRVAGVEEGVSAGETRMTAAEERMDDLAEKVTKQVEAFNRVVTNYSQRLADLERKAEAWKHDGDHQTLAQIKALHEEHGARLGTLEKIAHEPVAVGELVAKAEARILRAQTEALKLFTERLDGLAENVRKILADSVRADVGGAVPPHNATLSDGRIVSFIPKSKRDAKGPVTEEEEKTFLDNLKIGMAVADLVLLTGRGRTTISSYRDRFIADGKLPKGEA